MENLSPADQLTAIFEFVQCCPVFEGLDEGVNRLLAKGMVFAAFEEGQLVLEQGSPCQGIFLIVSGEAKVVVRQEPEPPRELARIGTGQVFGEMSLVTDSPVSADVTAGSALRVLRLDQGSFTSIAKEHPEVGIALTYLTAERLGNESIDGLGGKVLGGHRIERCVGRGNMAVVYRATCLADGQTVALKMMSHRLLFEKGAMQRFHREIAVLMTLKHDGIARHREHFNAYGSCFLAMEYCDGEDLRALTDRFQRLPETEVRRVLGQLAQALIHVHERGVLHCDIKPSNVMTTRDGIIKLTDFGLSRPRDGASDLDAGLLLGTPIYMPAEVIRGATDSGTSDLYALACVGVELLRGRPLFGALSMRELVEKKEAFQLQRGAMSLRLWWHLRRLMSGREGAARASLKTISRWAAPLAPKYRLGNSAD